MTKQELVAICQSRGYKGFSNLVKSDLEKYLDARGGYNYKYYIEPTGNIESLTFLKNEKTIIQTILSCNIFLTREDAKKSQFYKIFNTTKNLKTKRQRNKIIFMLII